MLFRNVSAIFHVSVAAIAISVVASPTSADQITLRDGTSLNGRLITVDAIFVRFESKTAGAASYPRDHVEQIDLGNVSAANSGQPAANAQRRRGNSKPISPTDFQRHMPFSPDEEIYRIEGESNVSEVDRQQTVAEVIRKLRYEGSVPPELVEKVKAAFPMVQHPVAAEYFDRTLSDLISGRKSLAELRADAIGARRNLDELASFLGPGGESLVANYRKTLDRFIEQSAEPR